MRDLPRSVYATPGMSAFGVAGVVSADDKDYGGLCIAFVARTASISKVRPPTFGYMTAKAVRNHADAGTERSAFLALGLLHVQGRPDLVGIVGLPEATLVTAPTGHMPQAQPGCPGFSALFGSHAPSRDLLMRHPTP